MHKSILRIRCFKLSITFLVLLCFLPFSSQDEAYSEEVQWKSLRLGEYDGFNTANILSFNVPVSTEDLTLTLRSSPSSASNDCQLREVKVYFQCESYPVISPYNESFPENFYLERSELQHVNLHTNNKSMPVSVENPKPGSWYLIAFLPKTEKRIKPKGFDKQCDYGLSLQIVAVILEDVEDITTDHSSQISIPFSSRNKTLRYIPPEGTYSYTVGIDRCYIAEGHNVTNVTSCPVTIAISMETVPRLYSKDTVSHDCNSSSVPCRVSISTPTVLRWNYIKISINEDLSNFTFVQLFLQFEMERCKISNTNSSTPGNKDTSESQLTTATQNVLQLNKSCELIIGLGRLSFSKEDFTTVYVFPNIRNYPDVHVEIQIPDEKVLLTSFMISTHSDSGGTLQLKIQILKGVLENTQDGKVWFCAMKNKIPSLTTIQDCKGGVSLMVNTFRNDNFYDTIYVPYPEEGRWYIGLHSMCYHKNNSETAQHAETCKHIPTIKMDILLSRCVENHCGRYGTCKEYISHVTVFSACECYAGWRGYGCTDGKDAVSDSTLLIAVLLLSLSNLFFIPGILVALQRRYFMEALVYTYNMFFSTFYHACDTNKHIHNYCLMKYEVLSFCDLFGSILSFWVTILAMARLSDHLRSFLHVLGALGIAIAVEYNQHYSHDIWAFVVPTLLSVTIMLISWVRQCYVRRGCFPSKKRYIKFLLPGVLLSGTGLIIFVFLETDDNYKYTHSVWHVVISLSIVLLLPTPSQKSKGKKLYVNDYGHDETVRMLQNPVTDNEDEDFDNDEPLIVNHSTRNLVL